MKKSNMILLLVGSFVLGVWVAAWAECIESYDTCGVNKGVKRRTENFCVQDSGPPDCLCCEYYVQYYDKNGDGITDCVVMQTISHKGDWWCGAEGVACVLKHCVSPTPTPILPPGAYTSSGE